MEKYLIGLDVGTTGTKAMLFTPEGKAVGHAYESYPMTAPCPGWCEQNPEDWWAAVVKTIRRICADSVPGGQVAAISLSTQGGTVVPVDEKGRALRRAIVWNDTRSTGERDAFVSQLGDEEEMYRITGWHLGSGLPALAIRWIREHEPEIFRKAHRFLTVPDYIALRMTGIPAVDLSNAGINQLFDITKRKYDPRLLAFAGVTEDQLARPVASGTPIGRLTPAAAAELGLTTDTLLTAGAHDQYAVALGAGAVNSGDIIIGSGTCWVITAISDRPDFSSGLCQSIAAVPGMWGSLQSLSSGGVCLDWLRKNVAPMDYREIDCQVEKREAAREGLFFFPFSGKSGDGTHFTRGSFTGLDLSHDRYHMAKAVMEGVAFQIRWMMEDFGVRPAETGIILAGGGAKSLPWVKITADILGLPVRIPATADLACVGAAILAGTGCGICDGTGCRDDTLGQQLVLPDRERAQAYRALFDTYKEIAQRR